MIRHGFSKQLNFDSPLGGLMLNSARSAACYVAGQGVNFLLQLFILHALGKAHFGLLGIAQLSVYAVIFIAELGMPSYFIREARLRHDWRQEWRRACLYRLCFVTAVAVLLMAFGHHYFIGKGFGFRYLVGALPGMFLSVFLPTPLLLGQNRSKIVAYSIPLQWLVIGSLSLLTLLLELPQPGFWLGIDFSAGYLVQLVFQRMAVVWPALVTPANPAWNRDMLRRCLFIWVPALFGTLYTLLLTYAIEELRPPIIAYFVLFNQIMQGVSGINMQVQRILLPAFAGNHLDAQPAPLATQALGLLETIVLLIVIGTLGMFFVMAVFGSDAAVLNETHYFCLILVEWMISLIASFMMTSLLATHREYFISRVMVATYTVSMAVQIMLIADGARLDLLLGLRILTTGMQLLIFYNALLRKLPYHYVACGLAIIGLSLISYTPAGALGMTALCIAASCALLYHLFRQGRMVLVRLP